MYIVFYVFSTISGEIKVNIYMQVISENSLIYTQYQKAVNGLSSAGDPSAEVHEVRHKSHVLLLYLLYMTE